MLGVVTVWYSDDTNYRYTNVSRRAIFKFIIDDARSLGKFVNNVLKCNEVKCVQLPSMPEFVLG